MITTAAACSRRTVKDGHDLHRDRAGGQPSAVAATAGHVSAAAAAGVGRRGGGGAEHAQQLGAREDGRSVVVMEEVVVKLEDVDWCG